MGNKKGYYSTKDMCNIFEVGRETLRHYENVGLLHPNINPENGYREYGYWDVGAMIDILKYRSGDYSLKEIKENIFNLDYPQIVESMHMQKDYYHDRIKHYKMLEKKYDQDLKYFALVKDGFSKIVDIDIRDLVFVPYFNYPSEEEKKEVRKVFRQSEFFVTAWITDENDSPDDPLSGVGFATEKEFAQYLKLGIGKEIGGGKGIGAILDIKGRDPICGASFNDFNRQAFAYNKNASKETYAILMTRFYDSAKVYHQYVFAYKKI
jgi:DNA-binding transcriptional MerR regulator